MTMKFGSMVNQTLSTDKTIPAIGDPATFLWWTDRHPGTVISVEKQRGVTIVGVQYDTATRIRGSAADGTAEYKYSRNPDGMICFFKRRKQGTWAPKVDCGTIGISFGKRERYYDPSF